MNWSSGWGSDQVNIQQPVSNPTPSNPWDNWSQDECLMYRQKLKEALATAKNDEMEFRKYIVNRAFRIQKEEGTNTLELGNGYELKAVVKYN